MCIQYCYSLEVQVGMFLKEERMEEYPRQVKPYSYHPHLSTYRNYRRASLKEVCHWKTW